RPLIEQYALWLWHAVNGNLGTSLLSSSPVTDLIAQRMPNTILIAIYALVISAVVGVPLGILAATRVGSRIDAFVTSIASLGVALPSFWLAILLVIAFSLNWHLFPATGATPFFSDPGAAVRRAPLPPIPRPTAVVAQRARQVRRPPPAGR